jgi:hypothetical protein
LIYWKIKYTQTFALTNLVVSDITKTILSRYYCKVKIEL